MKPSLPSSYLPNSSTKNTAILILQLQEEYNSFFPAILESYAQAGHSITETAELLGMHHGVLRRLVEAMSCKDMFRDSKGSIGRKRCGWGSIEPP